MVEAGSGLAGFVGKALGTAPEDTVGLLGGDHLRELRIRNLDKISRKTEEILRERGVEDPKTTYQVSALGSELNRACSSPSVP